MENVKKEGLEWVKAIVIGVLIFFIIRMFLFTNYVVEGVSMEPTLHEGNKLVVNKISYRIGDIKRFDVVVFHANEKEDFVKRIIGLPGDKIEYRDDKLYVNDVYYEEPYLEKYHKKKVTRLLTGNFTLESLTNSPFVPDGYVFVLGDNRQDSWDSRHFGFIPIDQVVGKVNFRYWPLEEWGLSF